MPHINQLSTEIFEQNKAAGWWDDMDRPVRLIMMLVVTEVAEASEGERKNLKDDKLPARPMAEVELADTLIRVLDFGGRYNLLYHPDHKDQRTLPDACDEDNPLAQHFGLVECAVDLCRHWFNGSNRPTIEYHYSRLIDAVVYVADSRNYKLWPALNEKREFNRHRADHKRENRAKENGKKY